MDEKSKLVVFDKKEVFLLFCLVILAAITSFVFGVKVGKNYSFERAGLTHQDGQVLDMKSKEEEEAQRAVEAANQGHLNAPSTEETLKRLEEEFNQVGGSGEQDAGSSHLPDASELKQSVPSHRQDQSEEIQDSENLSEEVSHGDQNSAPLTKPTGLEGKFTIQLGSYPSMEDAKQFAEGFKIRGYNPYIHEAILEGRGTWYRVTLGVFENIQQARDYIKQEESLFQGQDYRIIDLK